MKINKHSFIRLVLIQGLLALSLSAFVYLEMRLINSFSQELYGYFLPMLTSLVLMLYVLLDFIEIYARGRLYATFSARSKSAIAAAFLSKSPQKYGNDKEEEQLSFFTNKVTAVLLQYFYIGFFGLKLLLQFVVGFTTLLFISWQSTLAVFLAAAGFALVIKFSKRKLEKNQQELQDKKSSFMNTIVELHNGFEEIHLNQMEKLAVEEFDESNFSSEKALYHYRILQYKIETLGIGQNMFIYSLILIVGGMLAYSGRAGVGIVVSVAGFSVQLLNQLSMLFRVRVVMNGVVGLKKEVEAYLHTENLTKTLPRNDKNSVLEVADLAYGFKGESDLFENLSFNIKKGEKFLITGNSGVGKSTLLELLVGRKEYQRGDIIHYTNHVAYVPQNPFLFPGSLRENIVFDRKDADEEILSILDKLELDLPLDFVVEEKGSNLSGGQKVRAVLARALCSRPDLLIIDELTANLDRELGRRIEEMLLKDYPLLALLSVAHKSYHLKDYNQHLHMSSQGLARNI